MCCSSKRDKAVLSAMLWRAKTNIFRNKKGTFKALNMTLVMAFLIIIFKFILKSVTVEVNAQDYVSVTSSGNIFTGSNYFVDSSISTNFSLPNCTAGTIATNTIAYIQPAASSAYYNQEIATIQAVNLVLSNAYTANNPSSPVMNFQAYAS